MSCPRCGAQAQIPEYSTDRPVRMRTLKVYQCAGQPPHLFCNHCGKLSRSSETKQRTRTQTIWERFTGKEPTVETYTTYVDTYSCPICRSDGEVLRYETYDGTVW